MAGETKAAKRIIADALETAAQNKGQTAETILFAILVEALTELGKSRSRADLESYISFHFDNQNESEWVVTRGC